MIKIAICDDDVQYMKGIAQVIHTAYERKTTLEEDCECILYESGDELIDNFIDDEIDVFFLDIECGIKTGFEIARELQKRKQDLGIVYISNYQHYVSDAFVCRPLGFVRKNFIEEDIKMPMINIIEFLEERKRKIIFEGNKGDLELYVRDIIVVEVFNHELQITLTDRVIQCKGQLSKYEEILLKYGFIKISRAIMVNKKFITHIKGSRIYLYDKIKYDISRRRVLEVRKALGKMEEF